MKTGEIISSGYPYRKSGATDSHLKAVIEYYRLSETVEEGCRKARVIDYRRQIVLVTDTANGCLTCRHSVEAIVDKA